MGHAAWGEGLDFPSICVGQKQSFHFFSLKDTQKITREQNPITIEAALLKPALLKPPSRKVTLPAWLAGQFLKIFPGRNKLLFPLCLVQVSFSQPS